MSEQTTKTSKFRIPWWLWLAAFFLLLWILFPERGEKTKLRGLAKLRANSHISDHKDQRTVSLNFTPTTLDSIHLQSHDQAALLTLLQNYGIELDDEGNSLVEEIQTCGDAGLAWVLSPYLLARHHVIGTTQEIQRELDAGRAALLYLLLTRDPAVGLLPPGSGQRLIHLAVVTGYRTDAQGQFIEWELVDRRGVMYVSHEMFYDLWTLKWIELSRVKT